MTIGRMLCICVVLVARRESVLDGQSKIDFVFYDKQLLRDEWNSISPKYSPFGTTLTK